MWTIDLRSDTVTLPPPAMRQAMLEAALGDDVFGEDPTVRELEMRAAALLGKEAALFVPSGTMGNLLAAMTHMQPGDELICGETMHIYTSEAGGAARLAGVSSRTLRQTGAALDPAEVAAAIRPVNWHSPRTALICVEQPQHGWIMPMDNLEAVAAVAREHRLPLHLDGARIFNAALELGLPARDIARHADTVMFCVSKGLGAPVGSLLCGRAAVIDEARSQRQRMGGGWRQAGMLAAAGIMAIEEGAARLEEDHARAQRLALALADRFPGSVDPDIVRTNIVCARADRLPHGFLEMLDARGVRAGTIDSDTIRLVTHRDVDEADIDRAIAAFDALALEAVEARRARAVEAADE